MKSYKQKSIYEDSVQKHIIQHLKRKGWSRNPHQKELHEHGVDIRVSNKNYGRDWLIECKGDSRRAKSPDSSRQASFHHVFGQIIKRMRSEGKLGYRYGNKYGVGFPISFKDLVIKNLHYSVCYKLTLFIFLVDSKGNVEEFDYKKMKKLQMKK